MEEEERGVVGSGADHAGRDPAQLALRVIEAVNRHDVDALRALDAPDVVDDFVAVGVFTGVDAVAGFFEELFAAMPDFRVDVHDVTAEGDTAVVQWRASATFTGGPFQGIHATDRDVALRGVDVMRFEAGLLKHNTIYYDGLAFARQIGLLPADGSRADGVLQSVFNARTDALTQLRGFLGSEH